LFYYNRFWRVFVPALLFSLYPGGFKPLQAACERKPTMEEILPSLVWAGKGFAAGKKRVG